MKTKAQPTRPNGDRLRALRWSVALCCLASIATPTPAAAQSWKRIGTVTTLTNGQLCKTDGVNMMCDSTTPTIYSGLVGIGTTLPAVSLDLSQETDAISFPVGTTGQRPSGANGMVRYNKTTPGLEAYVNGSWMSLLSSGGAASLTLGSSAAATNPSRSGDVTTGFYTAGAGLVDVAASGTQVEEWSTGGVNITTGGLNIAGVNGVSFPKDFTTDASIAIGSGALASQPLGTATPGVTGNIAIGYQAAGGNTMTAAAVGDIAIGYQAMKNVTSALNNTAIGSLAMGSGATVTGGYNVAVGNSAANLLTSGVSNTALGYSALSTLTSGSSNTAIGNSALRRGNGQGNTVLGFSAALNVTGSYNAVIGDNSMSGNWANGGNNTIVGSNAFLTLGTGGANNVGLGNGAGSVLTSGANNTILGYGVGSTTLTTGNNNILIGTSSAVDTPATNTSNFLNIGNAIFATNMTGTVGVPISSVGIGTTAPLQALEVVGNIGLPVYDELVSGAGYTDSASSSYATLEMYDGNTGNTTLNNQGYNINLQTAGQNRLTVANGGNVGIGSSIPAKTLDVVGTGRISTSLVTPLIYPATDSTSAIQFDKANGSSNIMTIDSTNSRVGIGTATPGGPLDVYGILYINGNVGVNFFSGGQSLGMGFASVANGTYNIGIGYDAGRRMTGNANTAVGYAAMTGSGSATANANNTAVGDAALYSLGSSASSNTAYGFQAGYDVSTGSHNIIIGDYATQFVGVTTGSNNILMGQDVRPPSQTASNQLNIGNLIYATGLGSAAVASAGLVGIGTTSPLVSLDFSTRTDAVLLPNGTTGQRPSGSNGMIRYNATTPAVEAYISGTWTSLAAAGVSTITLGTSLTALNPQKSGDATTGLYSDAAGTVEIASAGAKSFSNNSTYTLIPTGAVGIGTTTTTQALTVAGNIALTSAGNTLITPATALVLEQTGDTFGTTSLSLENRSGLNGALFTNSSLDLVDFGFLSSTSTQANLRFEHRSGSVASSTNATNGEMEFLNPNGGVPVFWATFGQATAYINSNIGVGSTTPDASLDLSQRTDAISMPSGTTGQRPTASVNGMIRYNSTTPGVEAYISGTWTSLAAAGASTITLGTSSSVTNPQKSGDATTGLYSDAAGTVEIASAGTKTFSSNSTYTFVPTGSVGIGTTSPNYLLHVYGSGQASSNTPVDEMDVEIGAPTSGSRTGYGPSIIFKDGGVGTNVNSMARLASIYEVSGSNYAGALSFYTNPASPNALVERMRISNTGTLGIGTTTMSSSNLLEVNGAATVGYTNTAAPANGLLVNGKVGIGTTSPQVSLDFSTRTDAVLLPNGTTGQRPSGSNGMIRYNATTPAVEAYISGTWTSLAAAGASTITLGTSAATTNPQKSGDATTGLYSDAAGTVEISSAGTKTFSSNSTYTFVPTGNVGIGTTTPSSLLTVNGSTVIGGTSDVQGTTLYVNGQAFVQGYLQGNAPNSGAESFGLRVSNWAIATSTAAALQFSMEDSGFTPQTYGDIGSVITSNAAGAYVGDMYFKTAAAGALNEKMRITGAGKVGIGSTLPVSSLDLSQQIDAVALPSGTTGQRPTGVNGMIRYNSTTPGLEAYISNTWTALAASGVSTITLGTSTAATNPQRSGDATTGLYSAGAGKVDVSASGTQVEEWSTSGVNITTGGLNIAGVNGISFPLTDSYGAGSVAIGSSALAGLPASAYYADTAIGYQAMGGGALTTGAINNTVVGFQAMKANTSGSYNAVFGYQALYNNTSGASNTVIGNQAMYAGNGSAHSVAVGNQALYNNAGSYNVAVGENSMVINSSGGYNTTVGDHSLYNVTAGGNTALGYQAGRDVTSGNNNLVLGTYPNTGVGVTSGNYNIMIGFDVRPASQTANNQLNIGNLIFGTNIGTSGTLGGNVGIGSTAPTQALDIGTGTFKSGQIEINGTPKAFANPVVFGADTPSAFMYLDSTYNIFRMGTQGAGGYNTIAFELPNGPAYQDVMALNTSYLIPSATFDNQIGLGAGPTNRWESLWIGTGYGVFQGNVGIGTTSPQVSLDFSTRTDAVLLPNGTTGQRPSGSNGMIRYNSTTPAVEAYINGTWTAFSAAGASTITLGTSSSVTNPQKSGDATTGLYSDAAGTVEISSAGTKTFSSNSTYTFVPTGNVGIGTTTPSSLLTVNGTAVIGGTSDVQGTTLYVNGQGFAQGYLQGNASSSGAESFGIITSNWNIATSTAAAVQFSMMDSGFTPRTYGDVGSVITSNAAGAYVGDMYFKTATAGALSEKMRITGAGAVGIGSTLPVASLDISQKTDAVALPAGTTGQRPTGTNGMIRYNSTTPAVEAYVNGSWTALSGGGGGGSNTLGTSVSAASPQVTGDATTGLYTAGAHLVDVSANGVQVEEWSTSGVNITTGGLNIAGVNGISFPKDFAPKASIAIGSGALAYQAASGTGVQGNIAIGSSALGGSGLTTSAMRNIAIGPWALGANTTGSNNVAIGGFNAYGFSDAPLSVNTSGSDNIGIGVQTLNTVTSGGANIAIGLGAVAGSNPTDSIGIGEQALYGGSGNSIAIGVTTLINSSATFGYNVALGNTNGHAITTGTYNLLLGNAVASTTLKTGSYNILIGTSSAVDTAATASSYTMNIGNLIYGARIGTSGQGSIGIGSTTPIDVLEGAGGLRVGMPIGTVASSSFYTSLNASATAAATSLTTLTGGTTGFPTSGRLLIGSATGAKEIVSYTGTNVFGFSGVTRGIDGTTATAWPVGTVISYFLISSAMHPLSGVSAPNFFVTSAGLMSLGLPQYNGGAGSNVTAPGLMVGYNTNVGPYSIAVGSSVSASGSASAAFGSGIASGSNTAAFNQNTTAAAFDDTAIGRYNVGGGTAASWVSTDPLFEVGIGTGTSTLAANAFTILKNGRVGIGSAIPALSLDMSTQTDAIALPSGTTGQRPTGTNGMIRYNQTTAGIEAYVGNVWTALSGGGGGGSNTLGTSVSAASPQVTGDATTGLYTAGAGLVDVAASGVQIEEWSSGGANIVTGGLNLGGRNGLSFPADFTTDASIAIGSGALASQTLGAGTQANVAVGYQALGSTGLTTAAVSNTVVGYQAGKAVTSGNLNVFLGYQAGLTMISGQYNIAIGQSAAIGNTSAIACTAIGSGAAACNSGGSFDTSIGNNAASSGNESIAIGPSASATGNASFALGYGASVSNTNDFAMGTSQKLSGTNSLLINTTGTSQTMSGNNLVVLGGGNGSLSGSNNTLVGYQVGSTTLTTGSNNILLGTTSAVDTPAAGTSNFLNIANVIYGTSIGTAGQGNVGIGSTAPVASLDLSKRTDAIALPVGTTGQRPSTPVNGMLRYNSTSTPTVEAYVNGAWASLGGGGTTSLTLGTSTAATNPQVSGDATTGLYTAGAHLVDVAANGVQVAEFSTTGVNITTGGLNIAGVNGIRFPTSDNTPYASIAIGSSALVGQTSSAAYTNTAVGYQAIGNGTLTTAAIGNTAMGYQALYSETSGDSNIAIGRTSLWSNTSGAQNVAVGRGAGYSNTTGTDNVAIGYSAGFSNVSSQGSVAVGWEALYNNTASTNVGVGMYALYGNSSGSGNTALGYGAMYSVSGLTAGDNTAIGNQAATTLQGSSTYNTVVGSQALRYATTTSGNTALGYAALVGSGSPLTGANNTAIGYDSLAGATTTATGNTALGYATGEAVTTGVNNLILGQGVATGTLTTGSNNILLGTSSAVTTPASGTNNFLNIANVIYGTSIGTQGQGNIGIGSTSPVASLDLSQKTDAMILPVGTTGQRPSTPVNGMLRYNSTSTPTVEAYVNGAWASLGGGGGSSTITLGTSTAATNPQKSGDATTGLYSDAAGTVEISSAGTKTFSSNSTYTLVPVGSVGIGVTPSYPFQVGTTSSNGNGAYLAAVGVWTNASDRRIKENIRPIQYGLDAVMKLKPVAYDMKDSHTPQVGFIAQDVLEVVPEVVGVPKNPAVEHYGLSYGNMVAVAVKAIQDLKNLFDADHNEIEKLKAANDNQAKAIEELRAMLAKQQQELDARKAK